MFSNFTCNPVQSGHKFIFMQQVIIQVRGKIKKTGFRYFVKQNANLNKITGNVSYQSGDVLIRAKGENDSIYRLIMACWTGPLGAKVHEVTISLKEFESSPGFNVID